MHVTPTLSFDQICPTQMKPLQRKLTDFFNQYQIHILRQTVFLNKIKKCFKWSILSSFTTIDWRTGSSSTIDHSIDSSKIKRRSSYTSTQWRSIEYLLSLGSISIQSTMSNIITTIQLVWTNSHFRFDTSIDNNNMSYHWSTSIKTSSWWSPSRISISTDESSIN